jgi:TonB-linked SusC/RagA family outer membrane protein
MKKLVQSLFLMLLIATSVLAQDKIVSGKVTSLEDGLPLPGVSVKVTGTKIGIQTDANGNYSINVPKTARSIEVSFIGFTTKTVQIGTKTVLNVSLETDAKQLSEVIVTGYQTKTKADLSSAISVVSAKDIAERPNPSIDQLLQGKAAGVQITSINGAPGNNAFIRIRGTGSVNAGSSPLLVVNGVQIPDNMTNEFYSNLNANDVENISILKDAAAVSIYGARGSNGVLVITTKSGANSNGKITYTFQYGTSEKIPDNFDMMSTAQKLKYEYDLGYTNSYFRAYLKNNGFPSTATVTNVTDAQRQDGWNSIIATSHNWQDDILQKGNIQSHQVSAGGSTDKSTYYFSLQKYNADGLTVGSDFKRYTGNLNVSSKIKSWLTVGNSFTLGQKATNELRDRYNAQNPFYAMYAYNSYEPVFNADGSYNYTTQGFPILEAVRNNPEVRKYLTGLNSFNVDIHPIKGLNISSKMGLTLDDYKRTSFIKPGSVLDQYVGDPTAPGIKVDNGSTEFSYDWINKASYAFNVKKDHNFNVLVAEEFQKDQFTSYVLNKKGFASGDLSTQDNGAANTGTNGTTASAFTLFSLFGTADYNYKGKYFASGTFRRDGSSRFGSNNKYGNFYAASLSWLINQENFMKDITWINLLKIRGSIGTAGNYNIGNYQSLGLFGYGKYNDQLTAVPSQIANPNLSWETKLKRDVAVDFEFFKSRISGSIDYYNETTNDLLFNVPVSPTTGFTSVLKNVGALTNKGVETYLSGDIIRKKDFTWSVNGNITFNKNKVTKLYAGQSEIVSNGIAVFKPGYAYGTFKLVRWAGVNPQTGQAQYLDKDGAVTTTYSASDAVVLDGKSPNPKFFGGFGTSLNFKGLDLSAQFIYTSGNYTLNYLKRDLESWGSRVYYGQSVGALNYWKNPGDTDVLPKATPTTVQRTTDLYLQKASFMRFKNLTIGYTIPKAYTQKIKVQSLRVYVVGENLLTYNPNHFFGDPEVGYGQQESNLTQLGQAKAYTYPQTRQFTFGVNVGF